MTAELFLRSIKRNSLLIAIIIVGVFCQSLVLFRGGWQVKDGLVFPSVHDSLWNIAVVNSITRAVPPENPAMVGVTLKNHHYFFHLILAVINKLTGISVSDLYFRIGPMLVSLSYGLGLYAVSTIFMKEQKYRILAVFLGYFAGNFAYFLPLFLGNSFDWKGSSFFADQPFDQIFNPYSVAGFSVFLYGTYSLWRFLRERKWTWGIASVLSFGLLYGFKSFGGIIAEGAIWMSAVFFIFKSRDFRILVIAFASTAVFLPVFFLITETGSAKLFWYPGWLLTEMMVSRDKLNLPRFAEVENYYLTIRNYLGLIKIKLEEFLIYLVGNLGIRLLGLLLMVKSLVRPDKSPFAEKATMIFLFFSFCLAFFIPLLFNLGGNAFNIVQFTPYALVILSIMTAVALEKIKAGRLLLLGIILLAIPVNVKNIIAKLEMPSDLIRQEEVTALEFLRKNTKSEEVIMINPEEFVTEPIHVTALSERRIYLSSVGYSRQTGKDPSDRLEKINLYLTGKSDDSFLRQNNISYIYLLKPLKYSYLEEKIKSGELQIVFENGSVIIISTKKA